jgi:intracellular septation protein
MLALLDFIPLILFFVAYKLQGKFFAIGVLLLATWLQMLASYLLQGRKLEPIQKFTLAAVTLFSSVALLLRNEKVLQWWPTALEVTLCFVLLLGLHIWRKNPLQLLLGSKLTLPDLIWRNLAYAWAFFCLAMAALNAYIVVYQTYDQWMDFKLWSRLVWLAFALAQGVYIAKHLPPEDQTEKPTA